MRRCFFEDRTARRDRGFSLLAMAVTLPVMVAALGMAVDLGRMYVVRSELQAFADNAAAAACYELNGSSEGVSAARTLAATGPGEGANANRWDFGGRAVSNVQTGFAQDSDGPYEPNPAAGAGYRFVRVRAAANLPLYFLSTLPGVSSPIALSATATAGQIEKESFDSGISPFGPYAHDPAGPDFGFLPGQQYTIKWASQGQRDKPGANCPGDAGFDPGEEASDRGYLDFGQGNGNSALHETIVNNRYYLPQPLAIGSRVDFVPGNKHVGPALLERFEQDTDTVASAYNGYDGNGRRVMMLPVIDSGTDTVAGFAAFLLRMDSPCLSGNSYACCAEYVGAGLMSGAKGAGEAGVYVVRLVE